MSNDSSNNNVNVGDHIPTLEIAPIERATLAAYAAASGDLNPIHTDIDAAKKAGFDDVFAHGMLSMGYLARAVTQWRPQSRLRKYSVRFQAIVQLGDTVLCQGQIKALARHNDEDVAVLELTAINQHGAVLLKGEATVAV